MPDVALVLHGFHDSMGLATMSVRVARPRSAQGDTSSHTPQACILQGVPVLEACEGASLAAPRQVRVPDGPRVPMDQ